MTDINVESLLKYQDRQIRLMKLFQMLDINNTGHISKADLQYSFNILKKPIN